MNLAGGGKAGLQRELVIARTLNAPRELVFAAWTDPRRSAPWWGPVNYPLPIGQGTRWPQRGWNSAFDRLDRRENSSTSSRA